MAFLCPLIKKNLIYVKRNFLSASLQFLYPSLFLLILGIVLFPNNRQIKEDSKTYYEQLFELNLNAPGAFKSLLANDTDFAIIGGNDHLRKNMTEFTQTILGLCISNCSVRLFQSLDDYSKFITYNESLRKIGLVIQLSYDSQNRLSFSVSEPNFRNSKEATSLEEINLIPEHGKLLYLNGIWKEIEDFLMKFLIYNQMKFAPSDIKKNLKIITVPMKSPELFGGEIMNIAAFPSIYVVCYISTLFMFVSWLVMEKEKKIKDLLNRQGVTTFQYFFSWFCTFVILAILPLLINTFILSFYFFLHTSFILIFFNLVLFTSGVIGMAFSFHQMVEDVKSGQSLLKIVYVAVCLIGAFLSRPEIPTSIRIIFCFFPQTVLKFSFEILMHGENYRNGIDWNLFFTPYRGLSMMTLFIFYISDIVIFTLVGYILEVYNKSGLTFFEFLVSPCLKKAKKESLLTHGFVEDSVVIEKNKKYAHEAVLNENHMQQEKTGECLKIRSLAKSYGEVTAINQVSCELFKGQIFALLGHNGAGKTTLIKIISGMENPDSGEIELDGHSLITDKDFLFRNIGLCSQEDILFDHMTIEEHLQIMSEIKGAKRDIFEITDLLRKINLYDKRECLVSALSSGEKRKLCVAIAMIGQSQLILLDEPTSGMDVVAKHTIWEFLKGYKNEKIIILTTHSLDEAEYLGDRIGIMLEGELICSGTSSFLKAQYSCGYNINFLLDDKKITNRDKKDLIDSLRQIEPEMTVKLMSKEILIVNFPEINNKASDVFQCIEANKIQCSINNYTMNTTSLEDVFLKLNSNELSKKLFECNDDEQSYGDSSLCLSLENREEIYHRKNTEIHTAHISFLKELSINLRKNFLLLWRYKKGFLFELVGCCAMFIIFVSAFGGIFQYSENQSVENLLPESRIYYGLNTNRGDKSVDLEYFRDVDNVKRDLIYTELDGGFEIGLRTYQEVDEYIFSKFPYHQQRCAMYVQSSSEREIEIFNFFSPSAVDFHIAMNNFIVSSFMKREYGIDTNFITAYSTIPGRKSLEDVEDKLDIIGLGALLIVSCFVNISSYMFIAPLQERLVS